MKNVIFRTIRVVLLGSAIAAVSAAAVFSETLAEIKERGSIRLAGPSFPPYIVASPDGTFSGIDHDIVKGYAESIGVEFEVISSTWGTAIAGIGAGKWDVAPVFCYKDERAEVVTFLEPHYNGGGVAVVSIDSPITKVSQLNSGDVTFAYPAGTWKENHIAENYPDADVKVLTSGSTAQVMLEIVSGRANATVVDAPIDITKIDAAYPDQFRYLPSRTERLEKTNCVGSLIVDKQATELVEEMSAYIKKLKDSGGLQDLYDLHIKAVLATPK